MFLHVVGHNQRFRVINMTFRRSPETISLFFHQVLYAVGELRNKLIVPPSTSVYPRILGSRRWNPYFKDYIRAIDGTHVLARVPLKMQAAFRGRKHTITQNVSAAVDFDFMFTYKLAGWEGSAHDALILSNALERADGLTAPQGKFYLVDARYAAKPGFLPPFRGIRYHLREFGSNSPQNQRELFNLRHYSLRVTVERTFGALKNKFRILDNKHFHPYKIQDMTAMGEELVGVANEVGVEGGVVAVEEGNPTAPPPNGAQPGRPMQWTSVQSAFMLSRFHDLVGQGVKIDKGFKEVHVRMKDLSGALWNEEHHMIVLEKEHLIGHTKDHPADAKFLNTPIEKYVQMEAIFDLARLLVDNSKSSDDKEGRGGKRRKLCEEEYQLMHGMSVVAASVVDALKAPQHNEVHEDLYGCVMSCPGYSQEALMFALVFLLKTQSRRPMLCSDE
ncbi:uncharacterized protein LOC101770211 [Setaria italica]|uniref:uncharacterized protein LOC101770211 n=1 Tax=Setaria italica TaxID=4555 RepID=UPI0006465CC1|nr:uncharacterized protein LOC101770211 [Setaria italica]